ncbi:hypothetical protein B0H11DRAFT_2204608 [Mycena galericulata]|nr:hypothetical protein B0H11DRAFT_2204608 [Mycena galericulata]
MPGRRECAREELRYVAGAPGLMMSGVGEGRTGAGGGRVARMGVGQDSDKPHAPEYDFEAQQQMLPPPPSLASIQRAHAAGSTRTGLILRETGLRLTTSRPRRANTGRRDEDAALRHASSIVAAAGQEEAGRRSAGAGFGFTSGVRVWAAREEGGKKDAGPSVAPCSCPPCRCGCERVAAAVASAAACAACAPWILLWCGGGWAGVGCAATHVSSGRSRIRRPCHSLLHDDAWDARVPERDRRGGPREREASFTPFAYKDSGGVFVVRSKFVSDDAYVSLTFDPLAHSDVIPLSPLQPPSFKVLLIL